MQNHRRTVFAGLLLVPGFVFLPLGCGSAKVGDPCKEETTDAKCLTKDKAFVCDKEKIAEVACRGPKGCEEAQKTVSCDNTLAEEGDVCAGTAYACTVDKKARLACKDGKFEVESKCLGDDGCSSGGFLVECDGSRSEPNAKCEKEGSVACSADDKSLLVCKGSKYVFSSACKEGCTRSGSKFTATLTCKGEAATVGAPCATAGDVACDDSRKNALECKNGTFQQARACSGAKGCSYSGSSVECDE